MGRTVMLVGMLMMAGFVAMIMLNLSHAHSELDSLQSMVEMQSRELKIMGQANGQMAMELRSKITVLDNLTLKSQAQQESQERLRQQLSSISTIQEKLGAEVEKFDLRVDEMKQKVVAQEAEVNGIGEEMNSLKGELEQFKQLKLEVSSLAAAVDKLATTPPVPATSEPRKGIWERAKEAEESKDLGSVKPEEGKEPPEAPEAAHDREEGLVEAAKDDANQDESGGSVESRRFSETGKSPGLKLAGSKSLPGEVPSLAGAASTGSASEVSQVLWFKECGCTGIEIEAVTILRGLVGRLGADRVKTNKCDDTCKWPSDVHEVLQQISVEEDSLFPSPFRESSPHATVLVMHAAYLGACGMNEQLELVLKGPAGRKGLVLVSRSMVEVDKLEEGVAESCTRFDSVWVPSAQSRQAFVQSGVSKDRIKVLPEAVDTSAFTCGDSAKELVFRSGQKLLDDFLVHKPRQSFTFLSMFKWEPRKNWDGLLESFLEAFPKRYTSIKGPEGESRNVSVRLLIKTQILGWSTDDPRQDVPELLRRKGFDESSLEGRLLIFPEFLSSSDVPKLFKAVDGFVLPTHGEGWGLPLIEAMASGIPTISTGWGGQMDFMTKENSWPVSYELVDSQATSAHWAEPSNEALLEAMHEVVAGGEHVRAKVERACDLVHHKYNIEAVASQAVELMIGSLEAVE